MISKNHYLDLVDGKFSRTSATDLAALFDSLESDSDANHLVVHFHGGLVSRDASLAMADRLMPIYREAGAYPAFFIWNSDLYSTFKNNLDEIFSERIFKRLVQILANFVIGKLVDTAGGRSDTRLSLDSMRDYDKPLEELSKILDEGEAEYEKPASLPILPSTSAGDLELSDDQIGQLEELLTEDGPLLAEQASILGGLREQGVIERELDARDTGVPVRGSTRTLMSSSVLKELDAEDTDSRSMALAATLARHGTAIIVQVLKRYWHGRDHGLYTTIVEEVLRHLYFDNLGLLTWGLIKDDTGDAFRGDPAVHGGTAFAQHLARWWRPGRRLSLVGHSTGAIYIGHFLKAIDDVLPPEAKADVIFLAPACTFDFLNERLDLFQRRVARWRSFGLNDEIESSYWEVPGYRGSLLYMVSGLAEGNAENSLDKVDMPLLGMQRYFDRTDVYDSDTVGNVRDHARGNCVWSVVNDGSGRQSSAQTHGDFDEDAPTLRSVVEFMTASA